VLDEQNPRTDVRDRVTLKYTSIDPHRETKKIKIKNIPEIEKKTTTVAGNRVQPAREDTNRDTKITATLTPADLIIITRDSIDQTLITATNEIGTTTHHNPGPQYKTITHIVIDQHPLTSNQPRGILCAITVIKEGISLENVGRIWLVSTTRHVTIS
jgi:hypothetical protein